MSKIANLPEHQSALDLLTRVPNPQISEHELRERYLGYLCGEIETDQLAALWTDQVCNGRDSAVDVVAVDGKIIDRVPPLLMPYPTELKYGRTRSISAIVAETALTNRNNPIMGERFLEETMGRHVDALYETEAVQAAAEAHRKAWVDFLARWGKKLAVRKDTVNETTQPEDSEPTGFEEF